MADARHFVFELFVRVYERLSDYPTRPSPPHFGIYTLYIQAPPLLYTPDLTFRAPVEIKVKGDYYLRLTTVHSFIALARLGRTFALRPCVGP